MLTRRSLLGAASLTGAGLALGGCGGLNFAAQAAEDCLPSVNVADDRVIRNVVGLRPYRRGGFVVRAEKLGERLVVHNYGHGGGGITLSWGTARLAIELGAPGHRGPVAVLGAGAVGLATACLAQEAGFDVTIYAAALPPDTTSNIAGGQWYPSLLFDRHLPPDPLFRRQLERAASYSHRRFQIMVGRDYGVRWMTNFELSHERPRAGPPGDRWLNGLIPAVEVLAPGRHPFGEVYVRRWEGMLVETPVFLRRMLQDFRIAGGKIVVRKLETRNEVASLKERLIFNCTGLGARDLFGDMELRPMRGQLVVLLPQEDVRYAFSSDTGLYMFSRSDGVLLGGSAELDDWNLEPDPAITRRILDGHKALFAATHCVPVRVSAA